MDRGILQDAIEHYKADFAEKTWPDERYKWQAVKCFQDNWDIDAEDFAGMLKNALAKTGNLLDSQMNFPRGMLEYFAEKAAYELRQMLAELFDECHDVVDRILTFKEKSVKLLQQYGDETTPNHFQTERAITTYLWLRYPDKYYIYKFTEAKNISQKLKTGYEFKQGSYRQNLENFYAMYDELHSEIIKYESVLALFKSQLTEEEYPDSKYRTLVTDVGYYISKTYQPNVADNMHYWWLNPNQRIDDTHQRLIETYAKADFLQDVYMSEAKYERLKVVLLRKKNIILQGAPGIGKTYAAKRLAYALMGEKDDSRIKLVQFHQNYSYEDFVMGYKPQGDGFELRYGVFYKFCQLAGRNPDKDYYFIIDEINRGNLSKIFGELLMLIENDYRGQEVTLQGADSDFAVPKNLYIIGMMNTADRSLAMIDYALRRRFSFVDMEPAFDTEGFKIYQAAWNSEILDQLLEQVVLLNKEIATDASLGKGFCIGHSYFCGLETCSEDELRNVVDFDILPMLAEYWFDDQDKVQKWQNALLGVFHG